MKSVIIIRHAKSSWDNPEQPDFERPLNERGKRDAPQMAQRLLDKKISIDAFISSPARRAKKTASIFIEQYGLSPDGLILVPNLYHAGPSDFYQAIAQAPAAAKTIALFSHNPGITEFVNQLTNTKVDEMPTCAIFAVKANIRDWPAFKDASKEFWFFDYPKSTLV